jgi:hypothetical protein
MKLTVRHTFFAAVLAVATCSAFAQTPPPGLDDGPHGHEFRPPRPGFAVINDLEHLQRLYDLSGRDAEMIAIYHEVLERTRDPAIRHYVYDALARNQLRPADAGQAIATIRTSLDEDLSALAKRPPPPRAPGQ